MAPRTVVTQPTPSRQCGSNTVNPTLEVGDSKERHLRPAMIALLSLCLLLLVSEGFTNEICLLQS